MRRASLDPLRRIADLRFRRLRHELRIPASAGLLSRRPLSRRRTLGPRITHRGSLLPSSIWRRTSFTSLRLRWAVVLSVSATFLGSWAVRHAIEFSSFVLQLCDEPGAIDRWKADPSRQGAIGAHVAVAFGPGHRGPERLRWATCSVIMSIASIASWLGLPTRAPDSMANVPTISPVPPHAMGVDQQDRRP